MKIVVTGSSGLVGTALSECLTDLGHVVVPLRRGTAGGDPNAPRWDPTGAEPPTRQIEGADAIVHLAGENLAAGRWNEQRKAKIRNSRIDGTGLIARAMAELRQPSQILVSASAVGYYGDRQAETLTEESGRGTGFLAEVCEAWEHATTPARAAGVRVAIARFGIVLSARGGPLAKMLPPFRLGLGGPVGSGEQYVSWVELSDAVAAVAHLLTHDLEGPVNVVSPHPVTSRVLARTLGEVLHRPAVIPTPAMALRAVLGELADEALLSSQRAVPRRLEQSGFSFRFPGLEDALRHALS